jgi:hypothetical protein
MHPSKVVLAVDLRHGDRNAQGQYGEGKPSTLHAAVQPKPHRRGPLYHHTSTRGGSKGVHMTGMEEGGKKLHRRRHVCSVHLHGRKAVAQCGGGEGSEAEQESGGGRVVVYVSV